MADRNEWDKSRDREQEFDRERGGHRIDYGRNRERGSEAGRWENEGGRQEGEREGRGNFPRYEDRTRDYHDDYRRERSEWSGGSRTADFGQRGDWGRQGSWGTYGNRPSYDRDEGRGEYGGSNRGYGQYGGQNRTQHEGQYGGGMGSYAGGLGGSEGRHAGRGPKNWQRSDDRIKEDINERLTDHPQIDATEIDIQVRNGEVTIGGSVEDRRVKRMVEDLVEGVSGVKEVHNQLRTNGGSQNKSGEMATAGSQTAGSQTRK
jgi:BON domain